MKLTSLISLAAAIMVATAAPNEGNSPKEDPCSIVGKQAQTSTSDLSFDAVTACYRNIPYDAKIATQVLSSVESMINDYYAFTDSANGHYKAPFKTARVDFDAAFKKIRQTKWKTDYDFSSALSNLLTSVNDGHLAYRSSCYIAAIFSQPFSLYAPVVDGKQAVRIFAVDQGNANAPKEDLVDCEVVEIDGQPALKAVQDYADKYTGTSRDPSVRLADAFGSTSWSGSWGVKPGSWMSRWAPPNKSTMDYKIKCAKGGVKNYTIPWRVRPGSRMAKGQFHDTASYWKSTCANADQPTNSKPKDIRENEAPALIYFKERGTLRVPENPRNAPGDAPPSGPITLAEEVATSATTAFYRLKKGDVCVAVIFTESVSGKAEYTNFVAGIKKLRDTGCKKLIFDMTNNGGGSIDFAYYINQLFFPESIPAFEQDIKASKVIKRAAKLASNDSNVGWSIFDSRYFIDPKTRKEFTNDAMFTKSRKLTRFGKTGDYSQHNYFPYNWAGLLPLPKNDALPWKAKDMAIITNGWCGSACTMIATRFNLNHGVKTYVVGGIQKRPMSYFTFPGGFVYQWNYLLDDFKYLNMTGPDVPKPLPVKAIASFAFGEIYKDGEHMTPLEYDTKAATANVHLDHDLVTARHPDLVWAKIAADFKQ